MILESFDSLGGYFIENRGQVNHLVKYYSTGNPSVAFRDDGVMFVVRKAVGGQRTSMPPNSIDRFSEAGEEAGSVESLAYIIRFEGANRVSPVGVGRLGFSSNFFIGNNPDEWRVGVGNYREVVYEGLYDGVDLVYRLTSRGVKYEFILNPGVSPEMIILSYEGTDGLVKDSNGDLLAHTSVGDTRDTAPVAYQNEEQVNCSYILHGSRSYNLSCRDVDQSAPLVIDPLIYATYIGGSGSFDQGVSIAADSAGNAYVTGLTTSTDFPITPGALDKVISSSDAFVVKVDATGSSVMYATYLGGDSLDGGYCIAVDSIGNAFVTGSTLSSNFPVTPGAFDETMSPMGDVFVAKIGPTGSSLVYGTYLGGKSDEIGHSIDVDSAGNAYVTGYTDSTDFPLTPDALDKTLVLSESFVVEFDATGSSIIYATYIGGDLPDDGDSIVVDPIGSVYVAGSTASTDFPVTPGAFDKTLGGIGDIFVAKINMTSRSLAYATYLGGSGVEGGASGGATVAVDSSGDTLVTGYTYSSDFPVTLGAFDETPNGMGDVFVAKIDATGSSLAYATYIGGSLDDRGSSIALDSDGNAYFTGNTTSLDFPVTVRAFDETPNGMGDVFVAKIDATGSSLAYATYIGGSSREMGISIALDSSRRAYLTGYTCSVDFPVTFGAFDESLNGPEDMFVLKLDFLPVNNPPSAGGLGVQGFTGTPWILHVTDFAPDLNWTYGDPEGDVQAWYDIRVGTATGLGDKWDPPATPGPATVVTYGGAPLTRGLDYYFGVKVNDSFSWSPEVEVVFHVNSIPNAPTTPIAPTQSSTIPANISQTVSWTSGGDNESDIITYEWQVSTDTSFSSTVAQGTTTNTTSTPFATNRSSTYYWRVRARDDYEPSNWSVYGNSPPDYWTFITNANGVPVATNLGVQGFISPPGILHITGSTFNLNWTYSDPDGDPQLQYRVRIRNTSVVMDTGPQSGSISNVVYVGPALQRGVDYYFGVAVQDGYDWSPFSEVLFRLNSIPNPPTTPVVPCDAAIIAANPTQVISWTSGGDPDASDIVTFGWQVSTDIAFTSVISSGTTTSTTSSSFSTKPSTTYFWRVNAHDDWETTTWSAYGNSPPGYWTFSTSPSPNTPPTISITAPSGGELWAQGSSHSVAWTASDNEDASSALLVWINYTSIAGDGSICGPVAGNLGHCSWTLPTITATDVVVNGTVVDTGGLKGFDDSGQFTIKAPQPPPNTPPTVTIISPVGDEEWLKGSSHAITWTMHDDEDIETNLTIYINYTTAGAANQIATALKGNVSFEWALPDIEAEDVVVNITVIDTGGLRGWDESGPFKIIKPPPPPSVEANYKPLVALVFAFILAVVGIWSSKKRPWKGGKDKMAVVKTFALTSMPFVIAEAVTGVVSHFTGELSIPPPIGAGTMVDLAVLFGGLALSAYWMLRKQRQHSEEAHIGRETMK